MHVDCQHCGQKLEYTGSRPSFCGYCGKGLAESSTEITTAHPLEPPTQAPGKGDTTPDVELTTVGGYRLLRALGAGGMGTVYEAEDTASGRRVALKLIAAEYSGSPDALERFRREGRLASAIAHPRCVFVVAADEEAGRPYIVMELMPGDTLKDVIKQQGPLPLQDALAKILDVIDGLREAHRLGVVHRDVKPSNCFVDAEGRVKIGDFGLSKSLVVDGSVTRTGSFVGTPLFASPEQIRGEAVDHQTDVYSVAATFYCLLTGHAPFQSSDATITLARIVSDPVPPLCTQRPELPRALDSVVLRGLERDRLKRWRDLDAFRTSLIPFVHGQLTPASLGFRFGALLIDYFILFVGSSIIGLIWFFLHAADLLGQQIARDQVIIPTIYQLALWLVYFGLTEGLWGWSLGKLMLGLRVRTAVGSVRASMKAMVLRTIVFCTLANLGELGSLVIAFLPADDSPEGQLRTALVVGVVHYPALALGIGLIICTMRTRNGYRGLHEFASGTRVIWLPPREKRLTVGAAQLEQRLGHPAGLPERLGPYAVRGALRDTAGTRILLGDDEALQRRVVIVVRPQTEPPIDSKRQQVTRPARLRWVASGRHESEQWDAFLAPTGPCLLEVVGQQGKLPWQLVRPLLEQMTEELTTVSKEGTAPATLSAAQVHVQSDGRAQLLDWPLRDATGMESREPLDFLGKTAMLALDGRPWLGGQGSVPAARVGESGRRKRFRHPPVPEHAARLLARLLGFDRPFNDIHELSRELTATRDRATEVTQTRRAAQLAVFTAILALTFLPCAIVSGLMVNGGAFGKLRSDLYKAQVARSELQEGSVVEFVASGLSADPQTQLRGFVQFDDDLRLQEQLDRRIDEIEQQRQALVSNINPVLREAISFGEVNNASKSDGSKVKVAVTRSKGIHNFRSRAVDVVSSHNALVFYGLASIGTILLVFWPAVWLIWDFAWRGGFSLRLMGLSLARADGRKAARWQCAIRTLLMWVPVVGMLTASLWLETWYFTTWPFGNAESWVPWLSWGLWWVGLMLLPVYGLLAIKFPRRGLHDWVAGTYLVPR
jgi:eukaryotic-like serine/threonine-protein kinase